VTSVTNTTLHGTVYCSQKTGKESGLITMHPRKDVINTTQLKRCAGDGYRARLSSIQNNKHFKEVIFFTNKKRLKALYLPRLAQDSANKSLVLLGTASNHAKHPEPRTVDLEAFKGCIIVSKVDGAPRGHQIRGGPD
jgi:hypothetical protein